MSMGESSESYVEVMNKKIARLNNLLEQNEKAQEEQRKLVSEKVEELKNEVIASKELVAQTGMFLKFKTDQYKRKLDLIVEKAEAVTSYLDELNQTDQISYEGYSHLHDMISDIVGEAVTSE